MKILKELVNLLTKYKTGSIEIIGSNSKSRINEFYECILEGQFEDDDDAAAHFFATDAQNPKYRKLKFNLKKRLINTIFFIDVNSPYFNDYQQAYYNCHKEWAAIKMLLGRQARHSAIDLAENVLNHTMKYEFTNLIVDISKTLRSHFTSFSKNQKKYVKYKKLFNTYSQIWLAENNAESFYCELIVHYVDKKIDNRIIFDIADEYLILLKDDLKRYDSYRLHLFAYLIKLIKYNCISEYKTCSQISGEAIDFFETKPFLAKEPMTVMLFQKIMCHIQLNEYEQGEKEALKTLELSSPGTNTWFKALELYTLLAFHAKKYSQVNEIYNKALKHKNFRNLFTESAEIWKLYNGYIHLLDLEENESTNFKLAKFMNDVPIFSKDKKGMNIPVLILEMLYLIKGNKKDKVIEKVAAIDQYCFRHLSTEQHIRSYSFIKMLNQIPKSGFKVEVIKRNIKKYQDNLRETTLRVSSEEHNIEIIPYEDLWKIALSMLD